MSSEIEKKEKKEVLHTGPERLNPAGEAYTPDVDIYSASDKVIFVVELPGVEKGDVAIEVDENNNLIIQAKNSFHEPEDAVLKQYDIGNYYRAFQISQDYNKDKISARFENGLLIVSLSKREEVKPRRIEIKA
jgi:HSP20 family protein